MEAETHASAARSLLLVDDSEPVRSRLYEMLTTAGSDLVVAEAGTVKEARRLFDEIAPQTILLDLGLPDGDGVEVLRHAKAVDDGCVVVVLTNYADRETRQHCAELGADFVFAKSDQFELAAATARHALERKPRRRKSGAELRHRANLIVSSRHGFHVRPAAELVQVAQKYAAQVEVSFHGQQANAKSIMELMLLGANHGAEVVVTARGVDAGAALAAIVELFASHFHEEAPTSALVDRDSSKAGNDASPGTV